MLARDQDAETEEEEEEEAELQAIYSLSLSASTRDAYAQRLRQFALYLRATDPELVAESGIQFALLDLRQYLFFLRWKQDEARVSFSVLEVRALHSF